MLKIDTGDIALHAVGAIKRLFYYNNFNFYRYSLEDLKLNMMPF